MFANKIDFNSVTDGDFSPLPAGEYQALVEEIKRIRWVDGTKYDVTNTNESESDDDIIEIKYQIIGANYAGRVHFDKLRMWHTNQTAANIARARFKQLCIACNKDPNTLTNFHELYNNPLSPYPALQYIYHQLFLTSYFYNKHDISSPSRKYPRVVYRGTCCCPCEPG